MRLLARQILPGQRGDGEEQRHADDCDLRRHTSEYPRWSIVQICRSRCPSYRPLYLRRLKLGVGSLSEHELSPRDLVGALKFVARSSFIGRVEDLVEPEEHRGAGQWDEPLLPLRFFLRRRFLLCHGAGPRASTIRTARCAALWTAVRTAELELKAQASRTQSEEERGEQ